MLTHKDLPVFSFKDSAEFDTWLSQNYTQETGFWLRYYKKGSNQPTIVHTEAVDVALCWGWIDGLINKYDDISYVVRFTPRKKKSIWSKVNVGKVEKLILDDRMQPSGLKLVNEAKADGRWDRAYEPASKMEVPQDFIDLIKKTPDAYTFFQTLNKANLYAIGFRLSIAVSEQKRQQKIQQIIQMLSEHKAFYL